VGQLVNPLTLPLQTSHLTHPPCPSQRGEGTAVKEDEWRESRFHEGVTGAEILRPDAVLSSTSDRHPLDLITNNKLLS